MKIFLPQIAQKTQISHRKCSEMGINRNRIIEIDRVDSTNSYAERLLKERKIPEGTIIWAQEQTAGKGQGNNVWLSESSKNLTISMILYPRFLPVDQQFILNKAVSLGVIDFVIHLLLGLSCLTAVYLKHSDFSTWQRYRAIIHGCNQIDDDIPDVKLVDIITAGF